MINCFPFSFKLRQKFKRMYLNWYSEVEKMNTESPCNSITVWICYVLSVWIMEHHQLPWNSVFLSVKKDNTSWSFCNNHMEEWDKSMWNSYQWMSIGMLPFILDYRNVNVKVKSLSCVRLFATQWTITHQAPPSMDSPSKNTGVGCHFLLQIINDV